MKRLLVALFILFPLAAHAEGGERILSFDSFISVRPAGDMEVTETIKVACEGDRIQHGIYRDFPTRYKDRYGNTVRVFFGVQSVLKDGEAEPWRTEDRGNGVRVYMGSGDVTLLPGEYTYSLTYRTDRQLGFFARHDELYWNATGNAWEFPIEAASATVELPGGTAATSTEAYTGHAGDRGADYTTSTDERGWAVFAATRPLLPGEGLTIVVAWPKGFVHEPTTAEKARFLLQDNGSAAGGLAGIVALLAYYLLTWLRIGRDPVKGVIIPRYEEPEGFSPAAVRYVMRMGFDNKAFASAIVNMAVKGYLSIDVDQNKEYTLSRKGTDLGGLSRDEARIAQSLFMDKTSVAVRPENHSAIAKAIRDLRRSLAVEYEKLYFLTNKKALVPGLVISALVLAAIVILGRNRFAGVFMTLWLSGWTAGCAVLVFRAFKTWKAFISDRGTRGSSFVGALLFSAFTLPFLAGEGFGLWVFAQSTSISAVACIFVVVLLNVLFYHLMKAPTIKGRSVMDQIEGLKLYLSIAEKDRLNMLNPPERTPEVFERFLPYAFALDVEQEWCEQFADVLARARAEKTSTPAWYTGGLFSAGGAAGLAGALSSMSASISSSASPPGSSSGGGGGGSSGGGGGGGGGGGW